MGGKAYHIPLVHFIVIGMKGLAISYLDLQNFGQVGFRSPGF